MNEFDQGTDEAAAQRAAEQLRNVEEQLAKLGRPGVAQELGTSAAAVEGMKIQLRDMIRTLQTELSQRQASAARAQQAPQPAFDTRPPAGPADTDRRNLEAAERVERQRAADAAAKTAKSFEQARLEAKLTANRLAADGTEKRGAEDRGRAGGMSAQAALASAAAMGSGVMGLARAGDPFSAWPTARASLEGLAQALGETVLPSVELAAEALQRLEGVVRGLSTEQKSWIGVSANVGLAALGMAAGFKAAAIAGKALWGAMTLGLTPMVGIVGLTTAVGGLAAAYLTAKDAARSAGDAMRDANGAAGGGGRTAESFINRQAIQGDLPAAVRRQIEAAGGSDSKIAEILNAHKEKTAKEYEDLMAKQPAQIVAGEKAQKRFNELAAEQMPGMQEAYKAEKVDNWLNRLTRYGDVHHQRMEAAGRASGDAAEQIDVQLKAEGLEVPRAAIEAALNNALMQRMHPEYDLEPRSSVTRQADRERNARLLEAKQRADDAAALAAATGSDKFQMKRDMKLPAAHIGDPMAFYDRLQSAAINISGQEKSTDVLLRQIEAAVKLGNGLLTEIKMATGNVDRGFARGPDRY